MSVICAIERADDEKGSVGVALKLLELANRIINAEFGRFARSGDDLEVVKADDGSFGFVRAEGAKQSKLTLNLSPDLAKTGKKPRVSPQTTRHGEAGRS